jgi:hypothetical protein
LPPARCYCSFDDAPIETRLSWFRNPGSPQRFLDGQKSNSTAGGPMRDRRRAIFRILVLSLAAAVLTPGTPVRAQTVTYPAEGLGLPTPLPLFPADNWWNADVSAAPLDASSASFINFINAPYSGARKLHPDFGGQSSPGSTDVYGFPFAVVLGTQPRLTVTFDLYADQSDGVGQAFYPIPIEAETQPYWIEGGPAGNVDLRSSQDRHLLIVDSDYEYLYELYNVWFDSAHNQWHAGSGAFWDMKTNGTRPLGWTSADAAGLQILPGLVRYDEAYNAYGTNVPEIAHAFRVTVRSTNGYVYPASHVAGSTSGALPMGARLRLKASTALPAGADAGFTRIFNAMKKYGLIVADNGSDMYISGTYDVNWDNGVLNPLFGALTASDFEVVQLGWKPSTGQAVLSGVSVSPATVTGGAGSTGTAMLSSAAPSGGAVVTLSSGSASATVPESVTVPAGATSATFPVTTTPVSSPVSAPISGLYSGVTKSATLTINPAPAAALASLALNPSTVTGGGTSIGTVTLTLAAPAAGAVVTLSSSNTAVATVPASVTVPAGATSAVFTATAASVSSNKTSVISATYSGVTKSATLTVRKAKRVAMPAASPVAAPNIGAGGR